VDHINEAAIAMTNASDIFSSSSDAKGRNRALAVRENFVSALYSPRDGSQ
jgi:hypothetical protein